MVRLAVSYNMDLLEGGASCCCDIARKEGKREDEEDEAEKQNETEDKTIREEIISLYNKGWKSPQFVTMLGNPSICHPESLLYKVPCKQM